MKIKNYKITLGDDGRYHAYRKMENVDSLGKPSSRVQWHNLEMAGFKTFEEACAICGISTLDAEVAAHEAAAARVARDEAREARDEAREARDEAREARADAREARADARADAAYTADAYTADAYADAYAVAIEAATAPEAAPEAIIAAANAFDGDIFPIPYLTVSYADDDGATEIIGSAALEAAREAAETAYIDDDDAIYAASGKAGIEAFDAEVSEAERREVRHICLAAKFHRWTAINVLIKLGWARDQAEEAVDAALDELDQVHDDDPIGEPGEGGPDGLLTE